MTAIQNAPVHQCAEIKINAKPNIVWTILTEINDWPIWNSSVSKVTFTEQLSPGSSFTWRSKGSSINSVLESVTDCKNFEWSGRSFGATAVHKWVLEQTEFGTRVIVEESMDGWLVRLFKSRMNKLLAKDMNAWLTQLKNEAEH